MAITSAKVDDENGRRVPVVPELSSAPRWPWNIPSARILSPSVRRWMVCEGLIGLIGLGLAVLCALIAVAVQNRTGALILMAMMLVCVGLWLVLNQIHHWIWTGPGRQFAARAMAADGTCPSCGYGIAGVKPGHNGLATCPACSGAWHVGAIAACGNCGYDMIGTPHDERGVMVCPECSWEWSSKERL
ncbi:MAG: hypothetical protein NCW75_08210 [Phycisphaera sp.]|nr:MAG: hypothetical protein NCW75_08210 [Phycisphaera sp.]